MKKKIIRFLACSDIHSNLELVSKISKSVDFEKIDFILFNGDLSDVPNDFAKVLKPFIDNNKEIFMIPGNHETKKGIDNLKEFYNVKLIGNSPLIFGDNNLGIFGTNYMEIGVHGKFEEDIFDNMVNNFSAVSECRFKIQMNHIPASDTMLGDASPYPFVSGSEPLKQFLDSSKFCPDVCFVGHIHETSGLEEIVNKTWVINLAETFKIFEFNFQTNKLTEVKN
jgi:Icc-related predicted phosphoesterase